MTTLARKRIRMKCDAAKDTTYRMRDVFTGATPETYAGNDLQFELGVFHSDVLQDISNIATMSIIIRKTNATGTLLVSKTLDAAEMDATVLAATWADFTKQHALIALTGTEMNIEAGDHFLAVAITTNDAPGRSITLGSTFIKVAQDGIGDEAAAQAVDGLAYTKAEADARYVQKHADQAQVQFYNGLWYHYISSTGLWYPQVATIKDGVPILTLGEGVAL